MEERSEVPESGLHKLNLETGQISWHEIQPHFARGRLIFVAEDLDLVQVASEFAEDNRTQIENWLTSKQLHPVTDAQAQRWHELAAEFWAIVVKPWVLIQTVTDNGATD